MYNCGELNLNEAKRCALVAINEIFKISYWYYMDSGGVKSEKYWTQVKQEIEKL